MIKKASWLKKNLYKKNIKIIDASWYLPNVNRTAYKAYKNGHIENALFFDIDRICDKNTHLPHMLPSAKKFEKEISKLGINKKDIIIIYCKEGILSSPRVWWSFYLYGHKEVYILDGGLKAWKLAGGKLTTKKTIIEITNYKCNVIKDKITDYYKLNIFLKQDNPNLTVIDARPELRFLKIEPEPRKNIGKGNIPKSINYPSTLFDIKGFLKTKTEIKKIFSKIKKNKHIVCSCGSGVAACNVALSLNYIGKKNWSVYDGSWTEWYLNKKNYSL